MNQYLIKVKLSAHFKDLLSEDSKNNNIFIRDMLSVDVSSLTLIFNDYHQIITLLHVLRILHFIPLNQFRISG